MNRGVILDRDGTLIDFYRDTELGVVTPAFHPDQVRLLPGVIEGLRTLRDAGYRLAVATNQPDAAKGRVSIEAIRRTNARLVEALADEAIHVERLEVCLHHPDGREPSLSRLCACRKPAPGMLEAIREALDLDPAQSWMIGDTHHDLEAARAAGFRAGLLMLRDRCELCPMRGLPLEGAAPDLRATRLDTLAAAIVSGGFQPS